MDGMGTPGEGLGRCSHALIDHQIPSGHLTKMERVGAEGGTPQIPASIHSRFGQGLVKEGFGPRVEESGNCTSVTPTSPWG